jgi:hypothetical protein
MVEYLTVNQILTQLNVFRLIYSYVRNVICSDKNKLAQPRQFLSLDEKVWKHKQSATILASPVVFI